MGATGAGPSRPPARPIGRVATRVGSGRRDGAHTAETPRACGGRRTVNPPYENENDLRREPAYGIGEPRPGCTAHPIGAHEAESEDAGR